jgi:hypothetical protein
MGRLPCKTISSSDIVIADCEEYARRHAVQRFKEAWGRDAQVLASVLILLPEQHLKQISELYREKHETQTPQG